MDKLNSYYFNQCYTKQKISNSKSVEINKRTHFYFGLYLLICVCMNAHLIKKSRLPKFGKVSKLFFQIN